MIDTIPAGASIRQTERDFEVQLERWVDHSIAAVWRMLTDSAARTRLLVTLQLPADEDVAKSAAGWGSHREMLLAAPEGVPIRFPVDHFLARREGLRALRPHAGASG